MKALITIGWFIGCAGAGWLMPDHAGEGMIAFGALLILKEIAEVLAGMRS